MQTRYMHIFWCFKIRFLIFFIFKLIVTNSTRNHYILINWRLHGLILILIYSRMEFEPILCAASYTIYACLNKLRFCYICETHYAFICCLSYITFLLYIELFTNERSDCPIYLVRNAQITSNHCINRYPVRHLFWYDANDIVY